MPGSVGASRGTKKRHPFTVGRGPVPRHPSRTHNPTLAGDRPPRYGKKTVFVTVGRGPVPRHASRTPTIARDRPSRSGERNGSYYRRARACPSPCLGLSEPRGGQKKNVPFIVGRGPVPRHAWVCRSLAGERKKRPFHRRARACPSPCLAHSNAREGQALALRARNGQLRIARDRPSRYGKKRHFTVRAPDPVVQDRLILNRL